MKAVGDSVSAVGSTDLLKVKRVMLPLTRRRSKCSSRLWPKLWVHDAKYYCSYLTITIDRRSFSALHIL